MDKGHPLERQRPDERHPSAGKGPAEKLGAVALPLRVDASLLEVIKEASGGRPGGASCPVEQNPDHTGKIGLGCVMQADRLVQPVDESGHTTAETPVGSRPLCRLAGRQAPQSPEEDRCSDVVAPAGGSECATAEVSREPPRESPWRGGEPSGGEPSGGSSRCWLQRLGE